MKKIILIIALILIVKFQLTADDSHTKPKNIILMIADGWGYNQILVTNYYIDGKSPARRYEQFPVSCAMATYPAFSGYDASLPDSLLPKGKRGYDTHLAWSDFNYVLTNFTESAAAGTALACGEKTYLNRISVDTNGKPLLTITEFAKNLGKSAGVITTVYWSNATPAVFAAHNISRKNYAEIAREMLLESKLDVIMGAGHPNFDANGKPVDSSIYEFIGGRDVFYSLSSAGYSEHLVSVEKNKLKVQDIDGDGIADPWAFIDTKEQFRDLATSSHPPKRVCGTAQNIYTLQQGRTWNAMLAAPYANKLLDNQPDLSCMTLGAINVLKRNPNGFFLMVEGGAVDWANHENQLERLIEEMDDFNKAVDKVIDWIEANGGWSENLLIVTGDHECGYLTGPKPLDNSPETNPVINKQKGNLPEAKFNSKDHTNSLIPLFAKGAGSELFAKYADEWDTVRGWYIQNSEVGRLMFKLWE
jgi:alkaline phosphatase